MINFSLSSKQLNSHAFILLKCVIILVPPYIVCKYLYVRYKDDRKRYEEAVLFRKRHNCVVMYRSGKGHSGWPTLISANNISIKNIDLLYEPFMYFIDTAKKSLDIAIMSISVKPIIDALINAHKRGIKIRVISNFYTNVGKTNYYKEMKRQNIPIMFYVSTDKTDSIMHTKFIVKDFDDTDGGYLLTGSFNLTLTAFTSNYEDVVFTSNRVIVEDFHKNFEEMWQYFISDNTRAFNRLILENAGFLP
ncbi:hypothetical protein WA026_016940 [Henosepilachna vigintioctopunctata]|uniref:Mitochondrial cardiolipin hydrolase n=1 Tax=Henosepilachna vigintioctopunctata TaxID=420089 RepID=A0AAW1U942_9CUCU